MCSAEFILQPPGHRPAIYIEEWTGETWRHVYEGLIKRRRKEEERKTRGASPPVHLFDRLRTERGEVERQRTGMMSIWGPQTTAAHIQSNNCLFTGLLYLFNCSVCCHVSADRMCEDQMLSCRVLRGHLLVRETIHPSRAATRKCLFFFLFPLPVHTDVSCCVGWHLLLVINMLLCFFNRISDQFYNLTYVRELTALESAAHLTVLIFTVTVRMCLCLITCS